MKTIFNHLYASTILLTIILIPAISNAATYTTLRDGTWDNTTNVWSTDGETPCECTPGANSNGNDIVVLHNISIQQRLQFDGGSTVTFQNTVVTNSKHIEVKSATFILDFSLLLIANDKLKIRSNGILTLINGSKIMVDGSGQDNLENNGEINLCATCCIHVNRTFDNKGTLNGSGAAVVDYKIKNEGTWSSDIIWCSGQIVGIPSDGEDCEVANEVCDSQALPVELTDFTGTFFPSYVELNWVTLSEHDNDYFRIMKSTDAQNWTQIGMVNGHGTTEERNCYAFPDHDLNFTIAYYRLIQVDLSGRMTYSPYITLEKDSEQEEIIIYPNPISSDELTISNLTLNEGIVFIANDQGIIVEQKSIDGLSTEIKMDITSLKPSTYIINVKQCGNSKSTKLIIME